MNLRSRYHTKQRDLLLGYLKTVPGVHFTASDVCEYFKSQEAGIGQSTVYRQLERLVDEGVIKKYIIDGNSPACFEYVDSDSPADTGVCFHCKCEKCGKLIHMHCAGLEEVQSHLLTEHQFKVDSVRTVLYGLCENCM